MQATPFPAIQVGVAWSRHSMRSKGSEVAGKLEAGITPLNLGSITTALQELQPVAGPEPGQV